MRLRHNAQAEKDLFASQYIVTHFPHTIDEDTVIEIGMGKGEMITKMAVEHRNRNYIGIEKYATVAHKAMKRADEFELDNFRIICEDVAKLTESFVGKTNTIWLTFSDPWPKKRHAERRLTHPNFIEIYKTILTTDGVIKFKTDNEDLFNWTIEVLEEAGYIFDVIERDLHQSGYNRDNIRTGYEVKWAERGTKIKYLELRPNL